MNSWTRRLTMPLALVLLIAGCASATPPSSSPSALPPSPAAAHFSTAPPAAPASSPPTVTSRTVAEIARLQALVSADPSDAEAQRDLGFALLQRVRETADPSLYVPASEALESARRLAPDDAQVLA